jgi:hypothetical protein
MRSIIDDVKKYPYPRPSPGQALRKLRSGCLEEPALAKAGDAPRRSSAVYFRPIPGAYLFGESGSLFDRFISLFGRLGNLFCDAAEINHLAALICSRRAPGSGFSRYIPVNQ